MDNTMSPPTTKDPTTQDLHTYLKDRFEKKDGVSAILDLGLLVETKFVDDGTIEAQLDKLQDIRSRCALNEITMPDWQYAAHILLKLPSNYQHVKDVFLTTGTLKDLKVAEVRARIIETEICRKAENNPAANSLSTKTSSVKKKRPAPGKLCFKCGKEGLLNSGPFRGPEGRGARLCSILPHTTLHLT